MATKEAQQNGPVQLQLGEKPELAKHDSSVLDLAFAIDVTASMGSYIRAAQQSIRQIVETIVAAEKSDVRLALVEYRDHPPQDRSFVTRTHDFTDSINRMKSWLDESKALGGGDLPEAVADALHDVLKLSWREEATKICVLICDAPPHGLMGNASIGMLGAGFDAFPGGCPNGLDPVVTINQIAQKNITLYSVGCEPAINNYKDFFMALAHITGGQYVPLRNAKLLAEVIIGGAQEEITLQRLMEEVQQEVIHQKSLFGGSLGDVNEEELATKVHQKLVSKGAQTKALFGGGAALAAPSGLAQRMSSTGSNMADWREQWAKEEKSQTNFKFGPVAPPRHSGLFGIPLLGETNDFGGSLPAPPTGVKFGSFGAPATASGSVTNQAISGTAPPSDLAPTNTGFSFANNATPTNAFGWPGSGSGFGSTSSTSSGFNFGSNTGTTTPSTGGFSFGSGSALSITEIPDAGGFSFGSSTTSSAPTLVSPFGVSSLGTTFGTTNPPGPSVGLFRSSNSDTAAQATSLFGGSTGAAPSQPFGSLSGGLFGSSTSVTAAPSTGLFGSSLSAPSGLHTTSFGGSIPNTSPPQISSALSEDEEQSFTVVDTMLTLDQAKRMVKKALAMNKAP